MICTKCSPVQVANDAIADARSVCMREYATAPEVSVYGDPSFTFAYVPSHLHHMTFELVRQLKIHISDVDICTSEHHVNPISTFPLYSHQQVESIY